MPEQATSMIPQGEVEQRLAVAVNEAVTKAVVPLKAQLEEAKRTIQALLRQIHGTRAETSQVVLMAEGQQLIDATWHGDAQRPVQAEESTAATENKASTKRQSQGLAARHPHLPIDETNAPLAPELAEQVAAGSVTVIRTGRYHDSLLVKRGSTTISRVYEMALVKPATGQVVLTAPLPDAIVPGGTLADPSIHLLLIAKFLDAIPFHRSLAGWARSGVEIARQTVNDAFTAWCGVFEPLADEIIAQVLRSAVVHADESWARIQEAGRCRTGNIWTLVGDGQVGYRFTENRTHVQAAAVIPADFAGYLVRDAWQGWKTLSEVRHAGCNAHARRPFAALAKENADAAGMVRLYAELYRIEHLASEEGPPEALLERRRTLRATESAAVMDRIEAEAARIAAAYPFRHPLAEGGRYIANHRDDLRRFLGDPLLPPDNNAAENALRINALIRKNSLFFGSDDGGKRAAVALTVLHSCRLAKVEPLKYLLAVTPAMLHHRLGRHQKLAELTPAALVAKLGRVNGK